MCRIFLLWIYQYTPDFSQTSTVKGDSPLLTDILYSIPADQKSREAIIGGLLLRYPFLTRETIGESRCARPIDLLCIGNRKDAVLLSGGFHGMEWITSILLLKFLDKLCMSIESGKGMYGVMLSPILNRRGLAMVPCVNPDGAEIQIHGSEAAGAYSSLVERISHGDTLHWQANAAGVDINHNFDAGWEQLHRLEAECGITSPSPTRYGGEYPESEPESRALASICRAGRFSHVLAFHTQGEEIYYGYGSCTDERMKKQAAALSRVSGYRLSEPEGLACGGGFKDWFCQYMKKSGFTIEAGKGTNPLPLTDVETIYPQLEELMTLSLIL